MALLLFVLVLFSLAKSYDPVLLTLVATPNDVDRCFHALAPPTSALPAQPPKVDIVFSNDNKVEFRGLPWPIGRGRKGEVRAGKAGSLGQGEEGCASQVGVRESEGNVHVAKNREMEGERAENRMLREEGYDGEKSRGQEGSAEEVVGYRLCRWD